MVTVLNENSQLGLSWHDSNWIPHLTAANVMDYFAERCNPFYNRSCNNEIIRMQRLSLDQLSTMIGIEYILLHVQEPILYVIRKQHRHSPTQVTSLADYYIIDGVVYQAPDLASAINSRLLNSINSLNSSFAEAQSFSRYHPSKGYYWDFKDSNVQDALSSKDKKIKKDITSSNFQRQRVDILLQELVKTYPFPIPGNNVITSGQKQIDKTEIKEEKVEIKTEKTDEKPVLQSAAKPPPEKKSKTSR